MGEHLRAPLALHLWLALLPAARASAAQEGMLGGSGEVSKNSLLFLQMSSAVL